MSLTPKAFSHITAPTVLCVARGTLGNPFNVVLVPSGDATRCPKYPTKEVTVDFYDTRHAHTGYGQFVAGYYLSTLLCGWPSGGLDLMGYEPSWKVSAAGMAEVLKSLKSLAS